LALSAAAAVGQVGRYSMIPGPEGDGALRLDTQTGAVTLCNRGQAGWMCRSVADDRLALQSEIERLLRENRALRSEIESLKERPDSTLERQPPPAAAPGPDNNPQLRLPNEQDVKRLVAFVERMVRRFQGMMESLRPQTSSREQL